MNWLSFGNKNSKGRSSPEPPVQPNIYSHPEVRRPELNTNYDKMVTLPPGVDEQEWLATHTLGPVFTSILLTFPTNIPFNR